MLYSAIYKNVPARKPELTVHYSTIEAAKAAYPNCEKTALRAFVRSVASHIANKRIKAGDCDRSLDNVVAIFADPERIAAMSLRQRRFDLYIMLMQDGALERRLARRLVREGKLSAGVLA